MHAGGMAHGRQMQMGAQKQEAGAAAPSEQRANDSMAMAILDVP